MASNCVSNLIESLFNISLIRLVDEPSFSPTLTRFETADFAFKTYIKCMHNVSIASKMQFSVRDRKRS